MDKSKIGKAGTVKHYDMWKNDNGRNKLSHKQTEPGKIDNPQKDTVGCPFCKKNPCGHK